MEVNTSSGLRRVQREIQASVAELDVHEAACERVDPQCTVEVDAVTAFLRDDETQPDLVGPIALRIDQPKAIRVGERIVEQHLGIRTKQDAPSTAVPSKTLAHELRRVGCRLERLLLAHERINVHDLALHAVAGAVHHALVAQQLHRRGIGFGRHDGREQPRARLLQQRERRLRIVPPWTGARRLHGHLFEQRGDDDHRDIQLRGASRQRKLSRPVAEPERAHLACVGGQRDVILPALIRDGASARNACVVEDHKHGRGNCSPAGTVGDGAAEILRRREASRDNEERRDEKEATRVGHDWYSA